MIKSLIRKIKRKVRIMKCKNQDLLLLEQVYCSLGKEKFIRLYELMNNCCISELGIRESSHCKRTPLDTVCSVAVVIFFTAVANRRLHRPSD